MKHIFQFIICNTFFYQGLELCHLPVSTSYLCAETRNLVNAVRDLYKLTKLRYSCDLKWAYNKYVFALYKGSKEFVISAIHSCINPLLCLCLTVFIKAFSFPTPWNKYR